MEESTLALAQSLAKQTIHEESPPGSPRATRSHASILAEKVQGFRSWCCPCWPSADLSERPNSGKVGIFPARGRRRRWRCWKWWWWKRGADRGNVKTANKNTRVPSTRRHTACKDMATGSKPDTQEDFPNLCEEVFHRRTRSLNAPSPIQQFGPCGRIMKNSAMVMTIQDPASQRLTWYKPPLTVLVIKKVRDAMVIPPFIALCKWFINQKRMVVFVESAIMGDPVLTRNPEFGHIQDKLMTFNETKDDLTDKIDFCVCLGGDGTLLYASSLFQQSVPPIMAFHLGSLGFLTPFKFEDFETQVDHVLGGNAALTLRSRLRCILMKEEEERTGAKPATNQLVLNEVVIDRGPSPYLSNIDLYLDGKLITSVQGDGLIVSTPTGSTAYAVAAGASMIHPSVPAVMVTPICPHSLSFRPIVVPAGVELKISVSPDSRNTAWVSFDGRKRQELCHGDSLRVTTSIYPIPSICAQDQITDWFDSLAECLHWNVRKKQRTLDELSDLSSDPYAALDKET